MFDRGRYTLSLDRIIPSIQTHKFKGGCLGQASQELPRSSDDSPEHCLTS